MRARRSPLRYFSRLAGARGARRMKKRVLSYASSLKVTSCETSLSA
jgi:hypothetical protein